MLSSQMLEQQVLLRNARTDFSEINRLLAAAVVSSKFCALLLGDPARAVAQGFAGEQFFLSADEYNFVLSARGSSLQEFAKRLCDYAPRQPAASQPISTSSYTDSYPTMI